MAPEILQLLLLLSLGNSGKPGRTRAEFQHQEMRLKFSDFRGQENQADEEHRQLEEETFRVNCSYKFQEHDEWMLWCKKKEHGEDCNILGSKGNFKFSFLGNECLSSYDHNSGIMTIVMYKLRVNNSGVYECGILDSEGKKVILKRFHLVVSPATTLKTTKYSQPATEIPLTTSATPLATSSPQHSSIFSSFPVISVLCGLIVTKGLVFTALFVLLGRCRDPEKGRSHSELSQEQNDLK